MKKSILFIFLALATLQAQSQDYLISFAGTGLWYSPNTGATNESGFTAVPAGTRILSGEFNYVGYIGYWWSSSDYITTNA